MVLLGSGAGVREVFPPVEPRPSTATAGLPIGRGRRQRITRRRAAVEWMLILLCAIGVAVSVRAYVLQSFFIPSPSMVPTLNVQDKLLVDKVTLRLRDAHRGEIVVFDRPAELASPDGIDVLIKRVIGLPGEVVEGKEGKIFVNGRLLPEPYLAPTVVTSAFEPRVVGPHQYFLMGDNRPQSQDSRVFGPVSAQHLVGRALFRYWPLSAMGGL